MEGSGGGGGDRFATFSSILRVREKLLLILSSALASSPSRWRGQPQHHKNQQHKQRHGAKPDDDQDGSEPSPSARYLDRHHQSLQSRVLLLCQQFDATQRGTIAFHAWQTLVHQLMPKKHWKPLMQYSQLFVADDDDHDDDEDEDEDDGVLEPPTRTSAANANDNNNNKVKPNEKQFEYIEFLDFVFFPAILLPYRLQLQQPLGKCDVYEQHEALLARDFTTERTNSHEITKRVLVKHVTLLRQQQQQQQQQHHQHQSTSDENHLDPDERTAVSSSRDEQIAMLRFQIHHLGVLRHANLLRYVGTLQQQHQVFVIQEFHASSCTLKTTLQAFGAMKESTIRRYLLQLLHALVFLHQHGIPHGNLHCESVYIDSCGLLKCGEFFAGAELRRLANGQRPDRREEEDWALRFPPPEALRTHATCRSKKSDIWTIGILALQMQAGYGTGAVQSNTTCKSPRSTPQTLDTQQQTTTTRSPVVVDSRGQLHPPVPDPASTSKSFRLLVRQCLQPDPRKRLDALELLTSDFFQVDPSKETQQVLKAVCSDLDASMRRLERVVVPRASGKDATTASVPSWTASSNSLGGSSRKKRSGIA